MRLALMTIGVVRSSPARLRAGGLWWCLALSSLAAGCGRIGLELSPAPGPRDPDIDELDASEPSSDASDPALDGGEPTLDGGEPDAGAPQLDGCVPGADGGCATCDPAS